MSHFLGEDPCDHVAAPRFRPARPCPWYVAGLMAAHFAVGSIAVFSALIFAVAFVHLAMDPGEPVEVGLVAVAVLGVLLTALIGYLFLLSGQSIRQRKRRRYSMLCGAFLCIGGPLAAVGLLSLWGLSRDAAIAYYESAGVEGPGFPVVSPGRV